VLPTGNVYAAAGAQNQYRSILNRVGTNIAGLSGQFDGVQIENYWAGTVVAQDDVDAWHPVTFFDSEESVEIARQLAGRLNGHC